MASADHSIRATRHSMECSAISNAMNGVEMSIIMRVGLGKRCNSSSTPCMPITSIVMNGKIMKREDTLSTPAKGMGALAISPYAFPSENSNRVQAATRIGVMFWRSLMRIADTTTTARITTATKPMKMSYSHHPISPHIPPTLSAQCRRSVVNASRRTARLGYPEMNGL